MRHFHTSDIFLNEPKKRLLTARKVKLNAVLCRYPSGNGIIDDASVEISAKKSSEKLGFHDYLYDFISNFTRNKSDWEKSSAFWEFSGIFLGILAIFGNWEDAEFRSQIGAKKITVNKQIIFL